MKYIDPIEYIEVFKLIEPSVIPGVYEGRYYISNFARVYDTKLNRFLKLTQRPDGYLSVSLNTYGEPKSYLLHRLVGLYFVSGDTSLIINHLDGVKNNDFFTNLEWTTYSENNNHAFAHGLNHRGEDSVKAILTESQVEEICKHLDRHELSYSEIAETCNIQSPDAVSVISTIYKGIAWRHISCKYEFSKNDYKNGVYTRYNRKKSK